MSAMGAIEAAAVEAAAASTRVDALRGYNLKLAPRCEEQGAAGFWESATRRLTPVPGLREKLRKRTHCTAGDE